MFRDAHEKHGLKYVQANNDVANDYTKTDFTDDTNKNNFSIATKLIALGGSKAKRVSFFVYGHDNFPDSTFKLYQTGYTNYQFIYTTWIANLLALPSIEIDLDSNLTFDIEFNVKPTDWGAVNFTIIGWYE